MQVIPKPVHGSIEWQYIRHRDDLGGVTFGGSEAGTLIGVNEYETIADLAVRKLGHPVVTEPTEMMLPGVIFEPALIKLASDVLELDFVEPEFMYRKERFTVTLDGAAYDGDKIVAIVECKVSGKYTINDADDLPPVWLAQGHVQQWVTGAPVWFCVFDRSRRVRVVKMEYNPDLMDTLRETAIHLANALDEGIVPEWVMNQASADNIQDLFDADPNETINATDDLVDAIINLEHTKKQIKQLQEDESEYRDMLARAMGSATAIVDSQGKPLVTWREQSGRTSFDTKRFASEHPELAKAYERQGAPIRVLRFGKGK